MMKKIKLPPGFQIEVYAQGVLQARQMAWGDNGTLFVGSFGLGNVYAITDKGGKKRSRPSSRKSTCPPDSRSRTARCTSSPSTS